MAVTTVNDTLSLLKGGTVLVLSDADATTKVDSHQTLSIGGGEITNLTGDVHIYNFVGSKSIENHVKQLCKAALSAFNATVYTDLIFNVQSILADAAGDALSVTGNQVLTRTMVRNMKVNNTLMMDNGSFAGTVTPKARVDVVLNLQTVTYDLTSFGITRNELLNCPYYKAISDQQVDFYIYNDVQANLPLISLDLLKVMFNSDKVVADNTVYLSGKVNASHAGSCLCENAYPVYCCGFDEEPYRELTKEEKNDYSVDTADITCDGCYVHSRLLYTGKDGKKGLFCARGMMETGKLTVSGKFGSHTQTKGERYAVIILDGYSLQTEEELITLFSSAYEAAGLRTLN